MINSIKDLTPKEAKKVDSMARPNGSRPYYFDSSSATLVEITSDFEAWLILTPISVRARLANFFSTIINSKLNEWSDRSDLLNEWLKNEIDDLKTNIDNFGKLVTTYDEIRTDLTTYSSGFESVEEISKIVTDLTKLVGDYVERRDSLQFIKAVDTVLKGRAENLTENSKQEIQSWIKVLLDYQ